MSNLFHFDGRLASAPETRHYGETRVTKFTLIRNEYAGKDADGKAKQRTVAVQFTAFNGIGEAIAENSRKGDQLIVDASIENNNFERDGVDIYGYNFKVQDFSFGAPGSEKRTELDKRR